MKKYILLLAFAMCAATFARAQRMLYRQAGAELTAGTLPGNSAGGNYFVNLGLTLNGRNGNYRLWAVEYGRDRVLIGKKAVLRETCSAEGGWSFQLLHDARRIIALNGTLTGHAGFEKIHSRMFVSTLSAKIPKDETNFLYGVGARLSAETYLSDHLVLLLQGRTKVLWGTSGDRLRPSLGAGLRYVF